MSPNKTIYGLKRVANSIYIRLTRRNSSLMLYQPASKRTKIDWDKEFRTGQWDFLNKINDLAHYSIITGYCHFFRCETILDIGCGEGILYEKLCAYKHTQYVGIDISYEAICRAQKRFSNRKDEKISFIVADTRKYSPNDEFDVIIFNECLYYFENPLSLMRRYERFLKKNGIFIVSMFYTKNVMHAWQVIEKLYKAEDEVRVTNKSGTTWIIKVFKSSTI